MLVFRSRFPVCLVLYNVYNCVNGRSINKRGPNLISFIYGLHWIAQVWDVVKGEPLVNYRGHSGRVMTVAWSLMDPNVLFSGSDDFTVRSWRISQQVFKEPPVEGIIICIFCAWLRYHVVLPEYCIMLLENWSYM